MTFLPLFPDSSFLILLSNYCNSETVTLFSTVARIQCFIWLPVGYSASSRGLSKREQNISRKTMNCVVFFRCSLYYWPKANSAKYTGRKTVLLAYILCGITVTGITGKAIWKWGNALYYLKAVCFSQKILRLES